MYLQVWSFFRMVRANRFQLVTSLLLRRENQGDPVEPLLQLSADCFTVRCSSIYLEPNPVLAFHSPDKFIIQSAPHPAPKLNRLNEARLKISADSSGIVCPAKT